MKDSVRHIYKYGLVFSLTTILSACSSLNPALLVNPLIEPSMPSPDTKWSAEPGRYFWSYPPKPAWDDKRGYYQPRPEMNIDEVRLYGRSLQDAYRRAANGQIAYRSAVDAALIGTAAAAVAVAMTGGNAKTAGLLGLGAGSLGFAGDRFLIATRKRIWMQGAEALECVINATNAVPNSVIESNFDLKLLDFKSAIGNLKTVSNNKKNDTVKATIENSEAYFHIYAAFKSKFNPLSQILLSKIIEIRLKVEAEIVKNEPDMLQYDQALKGVLASTKSTNTSLKDVSPPAFPHIGASSLQKDGDGDVINEAISAVNAAHKELVNAFNQLTGSTNQLPSTLFGNCASNENVGLGPLSVNPPSQTKLGATAGTTILRAVIQGGKRPYTIAKHNDTDLLPDSFKASINSNDILEVEIVIPSNNTFAGKNFIIPIVDSLAATTHFVISFNSNSQ